MDLDAQDVDLDAQRLLRRAKGDNVARRSATTGLAKVRPAKSAHQIEIDFKEELYYS